MTRNEVCLGFELLVVQKKQLEGINLAPIKNLSVFFFYLHLSVIIKEQNK